MQLQHLLPLALVLAAAASAPTALAGGDQTTNTGVYNSGSTTYSPVTNGQGSVGGSNVGGAHIGGCRRGNVSTGGGANNNGANAAQAADVQCRRGDTTENDVSYDSSSTTYAPVTNSQGSVHGANFGGAVIGRRGNVLTNGGANNNGANAAQAVDVGPAESEEEERPSRAERRDDTSNQSSHSSSSTTVSPVTNSQGSVDGNNVGGAHIGGCRRGNVVTNGGANNNGANAAQAVDISCRRSERLEEALEERDLLAGQRALSLLARDASSPSSPSPTVGSHVLCPEFRIGVVIPPGSDVRPPKSTCGRVGELATRELGAMTRRLAERQLPDEHMEGVAEYLKRHAQELGFVL